ncbi:MAG: hypothetical protein ACP5SI_03845 [Chloroflexia bacterium]
MGRRVAWVTLALVGTLLLGSGAVVGWRWYERERERREAVARYIRETERFSTPEIQAILPYANPRAITQTYHLLLEITPPPEMQEAHENLLEGYRFVFAGQKMILQAGTDGVVRAEGQFMVEWGLSRVGEHHRLLQEWRR